MTTVDQRREASLSSSVFCSLVTLDTSLAPVQFSVDPEKRSSNPAVAVACSSHNHQHRLNHEELSRNKYHQYTQVSFFVLVKFER